MSRLPATPTGPGGGPAADPGTGHESGPDPGTSHRNEVGLRGRISAAPEARELPSGDPLVTFRVVVDRPTDPARDRRAVDVVDVACWSRRTQRSARTLRPGDLVEVTGALRRRFYATGGARTSRYEVEAAHVRRISRTRPARRPAT